MSLDNDAAVSVAGTRVAGPKLQVNICVSDDGGEFKADYISDLEEDNESDEEVVVSDNQLSEQEEEEKDD